MTENHRFSHTLRSWDGYLVQADEAFCRALDRPLDILIDLRMQDVTYGPDRDAADEALDWVRADGGSVLITKRFVTAKGRLLWTRSFVSVMRCVGGSRCLGGTHRFLPQKMAASTVAAEWSKVVLPDEPATP